MSHSIVLQSCWYVFLIRSPQRNQLVVYLIYLFCLIYKNPATPTSTMPNTTPKTTPIIAPGKYILIEIEIEKKVLKTLNSLYICCDQYFLGNSLLPRYKRGNLIVIPGVMLRFDLCQHRKKIHVVFLREVLFNF